MENAGYVFAGWSLTGVALLGYMSRLRRRRRAIQTLLDTLPPRDGEDASR